MFEGFSQETADFLWELSFHNERPWFQAHREQFERCLNRPFRALAQDCWQRMSERFPERDFRMHVSRIYRDARRLFGRGPYKDHLWFTLFCGRGDEDPCFWFELGAARWAYGLGFWGARPPPTATSTRCASRTPLAATGRSGPRASTPRTATRPSRRRTSRSRTAAPHPSPSRLRSPCAWLSSG